MDLRALDWEGDLPGDLWLLDQTLLPHEERRIPIRDADEMIEAIRRLAVRGAPAIGIAGAYGLVVELQDKRSMEPDALLEHARRAGARLADARPTAVNLAWGVTRMLERATREHGGGADGEGIVAALLEEARAIHAEDRAHCRRMGELAQGLLRDDMTLLTHCHAGALATGGIGTALAPIHVATEQGKRLRVFADETRPLLQGARITAWELARAGVDVTLLVDGAAPGVIARGDVDAIFVGSDRIAANGDVCNKVGTYGLAVLADRHDVPFYVVAPSSTFDLSLPSGADIPIEERDGVEVTAPLGNPMAAPGVPAHNPAFDVTPAELVTAIVTERGVIERPSTERVRDVLSKPLEA